MSNGAKNIQKVNLSIADRLEIVDVTEDDAFLTHDNQIVDLFQVPCKDLNASKEYDVQFDMLQFVWMFKVVTADLKLVSLNYPVDVYEQVKAIERREQRTENPVYLNELSLEKYWLNYAHDNFTAKEYYFMVFSKDKDAHKKNINRLMSSLKELYRPLRLGKKIQILAKMQNMNTGLTIVPEVKNIRRGIPKGKSFNPHLISMIQPQGGVSLNDERYIKKGDGYEACVRVFGFPKEARFNWLSKFTAYDNTITTFDFGATDRLKTLENINKSVEEQLSRYSEARYEVERFDAQRVYAQLRTLHDQISTTGEVMKRMHIRIYVYAKTVAELDANIAKIITDLETEGFRAGIFIDENDSEWRALFMPISKQDKLDGRQGKEMPSETIGLGHPYHFSALSDRYGTYWGYTKTNGTVVYDPYHKDTFRTSYSSIILGLQRSGKSTLLKKSLCKNIVAGNFVRCFATNKEYNRLIKHLGGISISLDGSEGFLNVLHVYRTGTTEEASFIKHVEKVCFFYKLLTPQCETLDLQRLQLALRELYIEHMGYDMKDPAGKITGRASNEYPILTDLLKYVKKLLYSDVDNCIVHENILPVYAESYARIIASLESIVSIKGRIFDGHSSIRDFSNVQLVCFNVAGLVKLSPEVFDAQMSNAMDLLWDNMVEIGEPQKLLFDAGELSVDEAVKYLIQFDEAHNFVNAKKKDAVALFDRYIRESPKYFAGIQFATHRITDFFPIGSTGEGTDAMRNLFSLSQYKFLFKQSPDSIPLLQEAFAGELPGRDLEEISTYATGECLMNVTGSFSIRFQVEATERELALYDGGA